MPVVTYEQIPADPFQAAFYDGTDVAMQDVLGFLSDDGWIILNVQFVSGMELRIEYRADAGIMNSDVIVVDVNSYVFFQDAGITTMGQEPFEQRYTPVGSGS